MKNVPPPGMVVRSRGVPAYALSWEASPRVTRGISWQHEVRPFSSRATAGERRLPFSARPTFQRDASFSYNLQRFPDA